MWPRTKNAMTRKGPAGPWSSPRDVIMTYDRSLTEASMISRADSGGVSPSTTYEIIRLLGPPLCHLLKAVENNLTSTGSTGPMRGVSSWYPRVDHRRCTNWLRFSLSRDSLPSARQRAKRKIALRPPESRHALGFARAVEVGCGIGFKLPTCGLGSCALTTNCQAIATAATVRSLQTAVGDVVTLV
jgi:hypothetical protein